MKKSFSEKKINSQEKSLYFLDFKNRKKETKFAEPTGTGGHKTAKDNKRVIDTSEWGLAEKKLEEKIKTANGKITLPNFNFYL